MPMIWYSRLRAGILAAALTNVLMLPWRRMGPTWAHMSSAGWPAPWRRALPSIRRVLTHTGSPWQCRSRLSSREPCWDGLRSRRSLHS